MPKKAKELEPIGEDFNEVLGTLISKEESQDRDKTYKATHFGTLEFEDVQISCAVLEDGTRVLVDRSVATALGRKGSGRDWEIRKEKGAKLPEYLSAKYLEPFIPETLKDKVFNPIKYQLSGKSAIQIGLEATILSEICHVWIDADKKGALNKTQKKVADKAYILLKAFSKVGIIALIDEATGFQKIRPKDALRLLVEAYIREDARKWTKEFYDPFFEALDTAYGNKKTISQKRPLYYGKFINKYIYKPIEKGIIFSKLKSLQSVDKNKRLHQFLKEDIGLNTLKDRISKVTGLLEATNNIDKFKRLFDKMENGQTYLFDDIEE